MNNLLKSNNSTIRILAEKNDEKLIINCDKKMMPVWIKIDELLQYEPVKTDKYNLPNVEELCPEFQATAYKRYTIISPIVSNIENKNIRKDMIRKIAEINSLSTQTIRNYLWKYLVYQNISALAPRKSIKTIELSKDEKNMRWALNKFFYTKNKNSLNTAYKYMLKEKYCDNIGNLLPKYPSFYQFRYFYRQTKSMRKFYISRNGLKDYEKNNRPLLGDGIHEFANCIGTGMLDSTICDIYLVNDSGDLVGRPYLTVCIDAYSRLCCGYSLTWEGGMYSVKRLMLNILEDKTKLCKKYGISIDKKQWDCNALPGILVTDMGVEYKSKNFEQITELGVTIINLPPYRPELKGIVEKFFDIIQSIYKPFLKNKGVIENDFQQRGGHDYRKDACLNLDEFNKIILQCIVFYNSKKILDNFPFTEEMLLKKIDPFPCSIWNAQMANKKSNIISVSIERMALTLLPRTTGKFGRSGLKVNNLRYKNETYIEKYLENTIVNVAYNPDNASNVWLIENYCYIKFDLIEKRYADKKISEVEEMKKQKTKIIDSFKEQELQAEINLASSIEAIASSVNLYTNITVKDIKKHRKKESIYRHEDIMERRNG